MKRLSLFIVVFAFGFVYAQDFNQSMVKIMKNMKGYTVDLVEKMPAEHFSFRPTDSVRTFAEQVQHMVAIQHFFLNFQLKGNGDGNPGEAIQSAFEYAASLEKKDLMPLLNEQFDQCIAFFENASDKDFKREFVFGTPDNSQKSDYFSTAMLVRDHISHHRAQLIVYLRLNNIKPPQYHGF